MPQFPSRTALEDNDAEFATWEEIPPEDVALDLFYALNSIDSGKGRPSDFADALQDYMILGAAKKARELYKQAKKERQATSEFMSTAEAWGIN